jgi:hypothetical protein
MSGDLDNAPPHEHSDATARRKLLDQRRLAYRRAIEAHAEQRQLQQQLDDYPELIAPNVLTGKLVSARRSAQPGR